MTQSYGNIDVPEKNNNLKTIEIGSGHALRRITEYHLFHFPGFGANHLYKKNLYKNIYASKGKRLILVTLIYYEYIVIIAIRMCIL